MDCIYLVALFQSSLLERYSFDAIIDPFVSDLKKLSAVSGGVCRRFFMLSMMTSLCHSKPGGCKMTIKDTRYDVEGTLVAFVGGLSDEKQEPAH